MDKLGMLKMASKIVVSVGVGAIVGGMVSISTPANVKLLQKICIGIGSFVLSNMICDKATTYTEEKIDEVNKQITDMMKPEEVV